MSVKLCNGCKIEKPFSEFHKQVHGKFGLRGQCKPCAYKYNIKTAKDRAKKSYIKHREKRQEYSKKHYRENIDRYFEYALKRKEGEKKRTPHWADKAKIKEIYIEKDKLNKESGFVKYHVDHVVPLNGKLVSGLHVPNNLQIILASENMSKKNKFEVTI
jgi:hypothetical protein